MRKAHRHTWLVAVMAAGLGASAQSPVPPQNQPAPAILLTLHGAVAQGLQHQPNLQLAGAQVLAAEARVAEAHAAFYPPDLTDRHPQRRTAGFYRCSRSHRLPSDTVFP